MPLGRAAERAVTAGIFVRSRIEEDFMGSTHRILLAVVALTLVAACTHVPRMEADPEQTGIREQYLQANPDGVYNDHIIKGEVVPGMNVVEVLASWGPPAHRERVDDVNREAWTYLIRDDYASDYVVYRLAFEERVLSSWTIDRHTAGNGGVTPGARLGRGTELPQPRADQYAGTKGR